MILEISHFNEVMFHVPVPKEGSLSIGRSLNNDVVLQDPLISKTHALLNATSQGWTLTDRSRNGTRVNGQSVTTQDLQINDDIQAGSFHMRLIKEVDAEDTVVRERLDQTQMLSYNVAQKEIQTGQIYLQQTQPISRKHKWKSPMMTLGKDPQNMITMTDDYASGFHCKITQQDERFFLKDLGSTNGTFVNDQKVLETELSHGDTIRIGKAQFSFFLQKEKISIQPKSTDQMDDMVSQDPAMQTVFQLIQTVAPTDATVFIHGETGTGKELVARALARQSNRMSKPFLTVNCGAISKDLIESELFGHEKGAFTSAHQQRKGLFEQAHTGTLFLDEIGELPLDLQAKLLRVLETGEIRRVGASQSIFVDVRIISATHRDLANMVQNKRFREDLMYRLWVIPITLPPLRDRAGDIEKLAEHFLQRDALAIGQPQKKLDDDALTLLTQHHWPGNIRELKNIIQRAVILSRDAPTITSEHIQMLNVQKESSEPGIELNGTLADVEKQAILATLNKLDWNKTQTAKTLGIAKSTLHLKIAQYELQKPD